MKYIKFFENKKDKYFEIGNISDVFGAELNELIELTNQQYDYVLYENSSMKLISTNNKMFLVTEDFMLGTKEQHIEDSLTPFWDGFTDKEESLEAINDILDTYLAMKRYNHNKKFYKDFILKQELNKFDI